MTPPRVAESPVALECVLHANVELGNSTAVMGRVTHAAIDEDVFVTDDRGNTLPDVHKLAPLARLGRNEWSRLGEVLDITRIAYRDWPGHFDAVSYSVYSVAGFASGSACSSSSRPRSSTRRILPEIVLGSSKNSRRRTRL